MKIKKIILIVVGCIFLSLGAIGAILPLLPAFPFLLVAAICFTKSSNRLDSWFKKTKLYKNNLEPFLKGEGLTKKAKVKTIILLTILFSIGVFMTRRIPVAQMIVVIVWAFHIWLFTFKIKTKEEGQEMESGKKKEIMERE